ncbi:MAG: hypothetical protein EBQ98_03380, partial [Actinobacteria bacterium]|nr:hypothetical protein [Actinomycetota bacterium]
ATLNFKALNRGDTLTVNGLRFTAARDLSASETAKAFEGLQSNATTGAGSGYGTYSNALTGFSSGLADGIATVTDATLLSWISTQITKASNSSLGTMPITFNAPVGSFDYLAQGEEVVLSYRITLTDVAGQSSSKDLTIKVVGTNDIPQIATTSTGTSLDPSLAVTETSAPETAIRSIPLVHGIMLDADNNAVMNVLATASALPSIQSVTLNGLAFAADIPLIEVVAVGGSPTTNPLIWLQDNELKINAGDARFQALAKNDQLVFDIRYRVQDQFGAISAPIRAQVVVNGSDDLPIISAVDSVLSASFTEIQDNQSPRTESTELTFTAVRGGDRVTVSGLSFTAARDLTGAEVASAFSGLAAGETGKANITFGLYSGSLSAFTSGGVSDSKVVFASTTPNSDVTNLASAITLRTTPVVNLPTKTIVDGVVGSAETANLIFKEMLAGDRLAVGGLSFTADRNLLATEVRDAFLGLSAGATTGAGGNYGVYSGALTGFSSANTASASELVFTSDSIGNVADLSTTLALRSVSAVSAPVSAATQGVSAQTEKIDITFNSLLAGQAISVGGLSFTATRNVSDVEVANAFKGLVLGATTGVGTAYGTYTNALTGFTTSNLTGSKVTFSPSQNRTVSDQYASTLVGVSAEYQGTDSTGTDWKAVQVLGTPNTLTYGSSVTSWSLPVNDMVTPPDPQWITVGFTNAVHANGIEIRETFGNGFVTRIDLIDASGRIYENVWQGVDPSQA